MRREEGRGEWGARRGEESGARGLRSFRLRFDSIQTHTQSDQGRTDDEIRLLGVDVDAGAVRCLICLGLDAYNRGVGHGQGV